MLKSIVVSGISYASESLFLPASSSVRAAKLKKINRRKNWLMPFKLDLQKAIAAGGTTYGFS